MKARIWITTKKGVMVTCVRTTDVPYGTYTIPFSEDVVSLVREVGQKYRFLLTDALSKVIVDKA